VAGKTEQTGVLIFQPKRPISEVLGDSRTETTIASPAVLFCQGQKCGIGNGLDKGIAKHTEGRGGGADIFSGADRDYASGADGALIYEREVGNGVALG
jgi:hypothetical protein